MENFEPSCKMHWKQWDYIDEWSVSKFCVITMYKVIIKLPYW